MTPIELIRAEIARIEESQRIPPRSRLNIFLREAGDRAAWSRKVQADATELVKRIPALEERLERAKAAGRETEGIEESLTEAREAERFLKDQQSRRAGPRGGGLAGLLGQVEATPVEGHPDLTILNHTEARTPALDAATQSFAQEALSRISALVEEGK